MTADQTTQPLDLAAVRARAAHVIAGPWTVGEPRCVDEVDAWEIPIHLPSVVDGKPDERSELAVVRYQTAGFQYPHAEAMADAEFIAAARADVPALLHALDAAHAEIERLHELRRAAAVWRAQFEKPVKLPRMAALIAAVDKLTEGSAR